MNKKKDPWWWNLIGSFVGVMFLLFCVFDYDLLLKVDKTDHSKARGFNESMVAIDNIGGKPLVITVIVIFILLTIWWAYKDYKNRFDD